MMPEDANPRSGVEPVPKPTIFEETMTLVSLGIAALSLFLFAWIAESVSHQPTQNFDLMVRNAIHRNASPTVTRAMTAITFLGGDGLVIAALVAMIAFLIARRRRAVLWLVVTLAGATVLDVTLKFAFHRPRPTPFFGPLPRTYSFPSGHALFSFCFYGVLAGLAAGRVRSACQRVAIWSAATLFIVAIGLSRIYLGVHYPSDVIAGYLTATIWVATMIFLDRWRKQRNTSVGKQAAVLLICGTVLWSNSSSGQVREEQPGKIGTVRMDANPKHILNSFDPDHALGTSLDALMRLDSDRVHSAHIVQEPLSAGLDLPRAFDYGAAEYTYTPNCTPNRRDLRIVSRDDHADSTCRSAVLGAPQNR